MTVIKLDSNKTRAELGEIMKIKGGALMVTLRTGKGVHLPFPAEQRLYKFFKTAVTIWISQREIYPYSRQYR